ncbi:TIR domain-containing protein, partial [Zoogloea sp.]|uniref:TIR domain-containing protein n=1 Tax=Zoogloea sp. TaxID=49181 RepID=UPI0035AFF55C
MTGPPLPSAPPAHPRRRPPRTRRSFAARLFGYDLFISFALGQLPRGTQSYASDLARQLRERDFAVFYSEDEAAPGDELTDTLRQALRRARILVVIANKGMLMRPGWVKTEVETFRALHPGRPIIPISIDGALGDPEVLAAIQGWLPVGDTIWLDETLDAVAHGIASRDVVERLSIAPRHVRIGQWWRATVTGVGLALVALTASSIWSEHRARQHAEEAQAEAIRAQRAEERARAELRNSTGLRLRAESSAMLAGLRPEPDERALLQLLAALRLGGNERPPDPEAEGDLLASLRHERYLVRLVGTATPLIAMAVSPAGDRLVTVADDRSLQLWNARTAAPLGPPIEADGGTLRSVAFSPDGRRLVTGSNDTTLRLWDVLDDRLAPALAFPLTGHMDAVRNVAFSPDGHLVASGSDDGTAMLWDVGTSLPAAAPLTGHRDAVTAVAFSPDGRRLVTGSNDNTLRLWDVASGKPIGKPFVGHTDSVRCVAFSPDGRRLVSGGWDNTLIVWDLARARPIAPPLAGHTGLVRSVAFSRDGREIVSTSEDGTLRLWDAATGAPRGEPLAGHRDAVTAARFIQDGRDRIASIGLDGSLRLWNPRTVSPLGAPLADGGHRRGSRAVSPDGKRIAGAGEDLRLHLWRVGARRNGDSPDPRDEPPTGDIALPPWPAPTLALRFSPDGARLAAGGYDGSLRILDGRSGQALGEAKPPPPPPPAGRARGPPP